MKTSAESIIPETRVQDIGDAEVPYLVYAGNGPALVLVHATGFLPWLWHPSPGTCRLLSHFPPIFLRSSPRRSRKKGNQLAYLGETI